jgi:hypothetical protein
MISRRGVATQCRRTIDTTGATLKLINVVGIVPMPFARRIV